MSIRHRDPGLLAGQYPASSKPTLSASFVAPDLRRPALGREAAIRVGGGGLFAVALLGAGAWWAMRGRGESRGLSYPPQPCGLPYEKFRSGWTFANAYEHVAWGRGDGPRTITKKTVLREMGKLKREEWQRYRTECEVASEIDAEREAIRADDGDTSWP